MPNREPIDINEVALLRSDRIALEEALPKADLMDGDNQLLRSNLLRFVERMDDVRAAAAFLPGEVPDVFEQVQQMSDRITPFQKMAHEFLRATAVEIDDQAIYRASSEIAQKEMEAADILADSIDILADSMKKQLINGAVSAIVALEADVDEQMAARLSGMTGIPAPELIACIRDMGLEIKGLESQDEGGFDTAELHVFKDKGFSIAMWTECEDAEESEHALAIVKVYEIEGEDLDGTPLYHKKGSPVHPDTADSIESAEPFVVGRVRWDGCADWRYLDQDRVSLHTCDYWGVKQVGEMIRVAYRLAGQKLDPEGLEFELDESDELSQQKIDAIVSTISSTQSSVPETLLVKLCSSLGVESAQAIARLRQRNVNVFGANLSPSPA